MISSGVITNN